MFVFCKKINLGLLTLLWLPLQGTIICTFIFFCGRTQHANYGDSEKQESVLIISTISFKDVIIQTIFYFKSTFTIS